MTSLPEKFIPLADGLDTRQNIKRTRIQFGDGYYQSSVNTVNPLDVDASLSFIVWGKEDLNEFLDFFTELGAGTLTYQFPNESTTHQYEILDKRVRYVSVYEHQVTVDIRRVY